MVLYASWVLYSAKRDKYRRACLMEVNEIKHKIYLQNIFNTQNKEKKTRKNVENKKCLYIFFISNRKDIKICVY